MSLKVSVLVAVYNTSRYIERCAHSLFQQTFKQNIEFIFINDSSVDDTIEKLQLVISNYPERHSQIKIYHHIKNRGLAASRNTALDAASGEYISVVDSDDYIEPNMIELLYNKAVESNADIVVSDLIKEFKNYSEVVIDFVGQTKEESFYSMLVNKKSHSYLCNKLVKRELYNHIDCRVPEGLNYWEDRYTMTRVYYYAKSIRKLNKPLYHYTQYNKHAISKKIEQMHFDNISTFWQLQDKFLEEKKLFDKYKKEVDIDKAYTKVKLMIDTHSSSLRKKYANLFLKEEDEYKLYFKISERIMLYLIRKKFFRLTQFYHNLLLIKAGKYKQVKL